MKQIDEYIIQGCCQGVFMEPTLDTIPWNMADETIFPIYEKCAEHNIPILFTIGGFAMNLSTRYELLPFGQLLQQMANRHGKPQFLSLEMLWQRYP